MGKEAEVSESDGRTWVAKAAELELKRREEHVVLERAVRSAQRALENQIHHDLHEFHRTFPDERQFIEESSDGSWSIIRRNISDDSDYPTPEVRFRFDIRRLAFQCKFSHRNRLDREFQLALNADGSIGLTNGSFAEVSEYVLFPVLFDELPDAITPSNPGTP